MADMEVGHLVDFCIEYNEIHDYEKYDKSSKKSKAKSGSVPEVKGRRKAQQSDWDAFWG